jgi:hypothetical protein
MAVSASSPLPPKSSNRTEFADAGIEERGVWLRAAPTVGAVPARHRRDARGGAQVGSALRALRDRLQQR